MISFIYRRYLKSHQIYFSNMKLKGQYSKYFNDNNTCMYDFYSTGSLNTTLFLSHTLRKLKQPPKRKVCRTRSSEQRFLIERADFSALIFKFFRVAAHAFRYRYPLRGMSRHVVSTNEIPEGDTHRGLVTIQERCRYRVCGLKLCRFSLLWWWWWFSSSSSRSRSATNDPISNSGIQLADQQKCARGPLPSLALTRATLEYKSMSLQSMTTLLFRRRGKGGRKLG